MPDHILKNFGITSDPTGAAIGGQWRKTAGKHRSLATPIDGSSLGNITECTKDDVTAVIDAADQAFKTWRTVPAPKREEFVRRVGEKLRQRKSDLAKIVQLKAGKITQEAVGEVQAMI